METIILGSTGIAATRSGFGALPIQRLSKEEAARLLVLAYEGGINFFDTASSTTRPPCPRTRCSPAWSRPRRRA